MVFDFFSIFIYLVLVVLIALVIEVFFETYDIKKRGQENFTDLLLNFDVEKNKSKSIQEKVILNDSFYESLFKQLFKINKELLLIQKIIFDK